MNLYVSNLDAGVNDADLKAIFIPFGEVSSAKVIFDRFSQASRGFGFVDMPDDTNAEKAMHDLNGAMKGGKDLRISQARPREEKQDFKKNIW